MTKSVIGLLETQSSETLSITAPCRCDECRYAGCHILFIVMLNVVMLSVSGHVNTITVDPD
jgi:hypothetical protein